jgi:NADH-quinone oxidoreductase subunit J
VTLADGVFGLLGVVALAAAVLVVTTPQIMHAALWLVVCLGAVAGDYLVLSAEFVAWVQVLIYVGAVVALILFGAMLTEQPARDRRGDLDSRNRPAALVAGVAVAGVLGALQVVAFRSAYVDVPAHPVGTGHTLGVSLFRYFVLPFEVASVLLLAALVGAVVLTRPEATGEFADPEGDR